MTIVVGTLLVAVLAVVLSEAAGRARVVYARLAALVGSYTVSCVVVAALIGVAGGGVWDAVAIVLSSVPLMAAWLGFRIHLTNSITLEMASILADRGPRGVAQLEADYDVHGHVENRVAILRASGYLSADADERTIESTRNRYVLRLIWLLCGPDGPRGVAARVQRGTPDGASPR